MNITCTSQDGFSQDLHFRHRVRLSGNSPAHPKYVHNLEKSNRRWKFSKGTKFLLQQYTYIYDLSGQLLRIQLRLSRNLGLFYNRK